MAKQVIGGTECQTLESGSSRKKVRNARNESSEARGIPGILHSISFENFELARNEALDCARQSKLSFDYLFLMDADMELVVRNPMFRQVLGGKAYRALQKAGTTSYWNSGLIRRYAAARYRGVTHKFLEFP